MIVEEAVDVVEVLVEEVLEVVRLIVLMTA
jgi:hypothetical protein